MSDAEAIAAPKKTMKGRAKQLWVLCWHYSIRSLLDHLPEGVAPQMEATSRIASYSVRMFSVLMRYVCENGSVEKRAKELLELSLKRPVRIGLDGMVDALRRSKAPLPALIESLNPAGVTAWHPDSETAVYTSDLIRRAMMYVLAER